MNRIRIPLPRGDDHDVEGRKIAEKIVKSLKVVISLLESVEKYRQSIVESTGIQISENEMVGLYFSWEGDVRDLIKGFSYLRDNDNKILPVRTGDDCDEREIAQKIMETRLNVMTLIEFVEANRQVAVKLTGIQFSEKEMLGLYFYWRGNVHDMNKGFIYLRDNKISVDDGNEVTHPVNFQSTNVTSKRPRAMLGDSHDSSPVSEFTNTNKREKLDDSAVSAHERPEQWVSVGTRKTSLEKCKSLMTRPRDKISAEENTRWVDLYNKYVQYFEVSEVTPHQSDIGVAPDPVAFAWLLEPDWHDQAYQELLSIRNMHSPLLEEVYVKRSRERFKSKADADTHKKHLKKLLNFLGSSSDEIAALSKEECYDRLIDIKCVVAYHAKRDASIEYTGKTQLRNWRDQAYERLQSLRKMHSCTLDDAYKYVHEGHSESKQLMQYKEECVKFLEKSVDFLGYYRADIVLFPEEWCCRNLKNIECFVEEDNDFLMRRLYLVLRKSASFTSSHTQEESSLPNWRDLAYEEIRSMRDCVPLDDYRYGFKVWSQIPELHELVEELDSCITRAVAFFAVSRHTLALIPKDGYARHLKDTTRVLERTEVLVSLLQKDDPVVFHGF